jgi:peroxin-19
MTEMMSQMEQLTETGDFETMLEGMMESLLSKDILHEPLQDLASKYPEYLEKHDDTLTTEEKTKYNQQLKLIKEILVIYDAGAQEDNSKHVIELLTKVN